MTIIYTTHDMDEADKICHRIIIMDKGKIIADGTSEELKQRIVSGHVLTVILEKVPQNFQKNVLPDLKKLRNIVSVLQADRTLTITSKVKDDMIFVLSDFFRRNNIEVEDIEFLKPTLEDVFIHLTKKDIRD